VLITPAKNEEQNLPEVARSVTGQTVKPELWIIVDDGSTDNTTQVIKDLRTRHAYIQSIRLPQRPRDITFHYSYVCKQGFDYALKYCSQNNLEFEYIGLLDADTVLEENYFGKLMIKFKEDTSLGIASGGVYYDTGGKLSMENTDKNLPRGTGRLWRKECFHETGGYPVEPSPDSISNVKAILRGWKLMQFANIIQIQKRKTSAANGLWHGYVKNGWMAYYIGKNPLVAMTNVFYLSVRFPFYTGLAYFWGYASSVIKREQKIKDTEIRAYYQNFGITGLSARISGIFGRNSGDTHKREQ
jgi:glycosyltransferase involved in cell wall biosynthesis